MSQEEKNKGVPVPAEHHHIQHQQNDPPPPPPPQYGTFQGVANYPPPLPPQHQYQHQHQPQPVIGLPQPAPPPGAALPSAPPPPPPQYYAQGYQTVPGYAVAEGRPVTVRERRLPCCGLGVGWCLFIIGFFLAAIPWYVGALILLCSRIDYREKTGFIACTVAAILATLAIILGVTKGADDW